MRLFFCCASDEMQGRHKHITEKRQVRKGGGQNGTKWNDYGTKGQRESVRVSGDRSRTKRRGVVIRKNRMTDYGQKSRQKDTIDSMTDRRERRED